MWRLIQVASLVTKEVNMSRGEMEYRSEFSTCSLKNFLKLVHLVNSIAVFEL